MSEKLTDTEMRLFCLGAAIYGTHREGAKIIADALDEMQRLRKAKPAIRAKAKRRPAK